MRLADLVRLRVGDELLQVVRGKGFLGDDEDRRSRRKPDRLEILDRVVLEIGVEGGGGAVRAFPAGALEITETRTRFVPFIDFGGSGQLAIAFAVGLLVGRTVSRRVRL